MPTRVRKHVFPASRRTLASVRRERKKRKMLYRAHQECEAEKEALMLVMEVEKEICAQRSQQLEDAFLDAEKDAEHDVKMLFEAHRRLNRAEAFDEANADEIWYWQALCASRIKNVLHMRDEMEKLDFVAQTMDSNRDMIDGCAHAHVAYEMILTAI